MRHKDQRHHDRQRYSYSLIFPSPLNVDGAQAWLDSLNGITTTGLPRLTGVRSVVLEVSGSQKGIAHRVAIPHSERRYVTGQLHSAVPGVRISIDQERRREKWGHVVELGMTDSSRTLRIKDIETFATRMPQHLAVDETQGGGLYSGGAASSGLRERKPRQGEANVSHSTSLITKVLWGSQASTDAVKDRQAKLDESNMLAVIRVAATAADTGDAKPLGADVCKAISTASTAESSIRTLGFSGFHRSCITG